MLMIKSNLAPAGSGTNNERNPDKKLLFFSALVSILAIILIIIFICSQGIPLVARVGIKNFLFSTTWDPANGQFGIATMLVGSLLVTIGALIWGVPLGMALSIFLAEIASPRVAGIMTSMVELLAGIPSVVYGFFGLAVIVPFIREYIGGPGFQCPGRSYYSGNNDSAHHCQHSL